MQTKFYAFALTALALSSTAYAQDLKIHTYLAKPEHFGVTSTLI